MHELFAVIANEWMKLIHRRRILIAGMLCLLVVGLYAIGGYMAHRIHIRNGDPFTNVNMQIQNLNLQINQVKLSNDPNKEQELAYLSQQLSQAKADLAYDTGIHSDTWRQVIQEDIASKKQMVTTMEHSNTVISQIQPANNQQQLANMNADISKDQYLLNHNIRPLPLGSENGYNQALQFIDIVSLIFLPLVIVVLVGDMLSGESTSGTIKLLLVRPVSRTKILLGKWIICVLSSMALSGVLSIAVLFSSILIVGSQGGLQPAYAGIQYTFTPIYNSNGLGQMQNLIPVVHYEHAVLLPQWELFLFGTLFLMFAMAVVATITFLFSTLFKSAVASTVISMGVIIVGFVFSRIVGSLSLPFSRYIFSNHLDLLANWTGQTAQMMREPITLTTGICVLLVWGIVSLALSIIIFSRRDILNA